MTIGNWPRPSAASSSDFSGMSDAPKSTARSFTRSMPASEPTGSYSSAELAGGSSSPAVGGRKVSAAREPGAVLPRPSREDRVDEGRPGALDAGFAQDVLGASRHDVDSGDDGREPMTADASGDPGAHDTCSSDVQLDAGRDRRSRSRERRLPWRGHATRGTDRRSASMRSIRKKARSALPRSSRIAPRSFPWQVGAQLQAPLARGEQELAGAPPRSADSSRRPRRQEDRAHRLRDLVERRVDQLAAGRRERLALDAPRDLEQRFAEAGGEVLLLDQAGEQVGLVRAACRA